MSCLQAGDILFRWLQVIERSTLLQSHIIEAQNKAIKVQQDREHNSSQLHTIPSFFWAERIGHVGIYGGSNKVVEVGVGGSRVGGLGSQKLSKRKNTDIVVRFPNDVAERIANIANESKKKSKRYMYPFNKLFSEQVAKEVVDDQFSAGKKRAKSTLAKKAQAQKSWAGGTGYQVMSENPANPVQDLWRKGLMCSKHVNVFMENWPILKEEEGKIARAMENKQSLYDYRIGFGMSEPVCSHFVHAVIYAAVVPGGTIQAATRKETEHIFNISPNMLWHYFLNDMGVFRGQGAEFCGVQVKGKISQDMTDQFLEVSQQSTG